MAVLRACRCRIIGRDLHKSRSPGRKRRRRRPSGPGKIKPIKTKHPTAGLLRRVAREMLPFSRAVASSPEYAVLWSEAVTGADLDRMKKLACAASPRLAKRGMGTNGIGYFISFEDGGSYYSCGITIPPGRVRFHFNPQVHRLIARALIPYYREISCQPRYRAALARAIRRNDRQAAARLVRRRIGTAALKSVFIEDDGLLLSFKYPFSKYRYSYMLLREFN